MRKIAIALTLAFSAGLFALPVTASQPGHPEHKLPICHRTAADSNPWVLITPDKRSWFAHLDRHVNHNPKNGRGDKFAHLWSDGSYRCTKEPPKRFAPKAGFGPVCGDPWTYGKFNNRRSEVAAVFTMYWVNGRGVNKAESKTVAPGGWKRTNWRWVKFGTWTRIGVKRTGITPAVVNIIAARKVTRSAFHHWNTGPCPANPRR